MNRQFSSIVIGLILFAFPLNARAQTGPGGISTNLQLWLRADIGVTESAGDVSAWADQSAASYDFTDAGAAPYAYIANSINYNPAIENTDGSDRRLQNTTSKDLQTVVVVTYPSNPGQCDNPFSEVGADDEGIRACTSGANWNVPGGAEDFTDATGQGWFNGASAVDPAHGNTPNIVVVEAPALATIAGGIEIGDTESSRFWHGAVAEVIGYNNTLSSTDRERIESYLAVKYGITLGHDYFASDGTVIRSLGGTYDFRLTSIGRDDASGLNQKQSISSAAGALVTIALGSYAADNASNSNTFDGDIDFMSWADDNGSTAIATAISGAIANFRMARVWKIKEVNGISTVEVRIPDTYGATHLISDDNSSFTSPTETALSDNGDGTWSASIDFANGDFFSFGKFIPGPGGVVADLWLKADMGVTETTGNVSAWADQSSAGYDFTDAGAAPYAYVANGINFNPEIENVDGSDRRLENTSSIDLQTVAVVTQPNNPGDCDGMFSEAGAADEAIRACFSTGANWSMPGGTGDFGNSTGLGWYNGTSTFNPSHGNLPNIYFIEAPAPTTIAGGIELAESDASNFWHGSIAEVVGFNGTLTTTEREKLESYLAIKYGITITHDYLASDGTSLWDLATYGAYHNSVIGIGRDDASALDQRQAAGDMIDVGLGSLAADNASNGTAFGSNLVFMMTGHDNASTGLTTVVEGTNTNIRMARTWQVAETGSVGSAEVRIPATYGATHLLVDDNSGFTSPTELALSDNGDGTWSATVDFADGDYFSFGAHAMAPAGAIANLQLWLRTDMGTNTTTDGSAITSWEDQGVFGLDAGVGNGTVTYESDAANLVNYQPVIQFNGTVDRLDGGDLGMDNDTSISAFYVLVDRGSTDNHTAFTFSGSDSDHRLEFDDDKWGVWDESVLTMGAAPAGSGLVWSVITEHYDGTTASVYANGTLGTAEARTNGIDLDGGSFYTIGSSTTTTDSGIFDIAEIIVYTDAMTADRERIESYLGLKYGISLAHNYTSSAGALLWDATANAAYHNDVAGIGRDDDSGLNQKQSTGSVLSAGLTAIASNNASNANTFSSDGIFLLWGHDGGALSEADVMFGVNSAKLLNRKWFIEEAGDTGALELQFDINSATVTGTTASDFWLVVDTDTDPTNGNRSMVQANSFSAGIASFTGIDLQDNDYLMLVTENSGDVTLPVELTRFEAVFDNGTVQLRWTTASETNNAGFEIQRRAVSGDGETQWRNVAFVEGRGSTEATTHYSFSDEVRAIRGNSVMYRLKQVDFNGGFVMSNTAQVLLPAPSSYHIASYPNPFNPVATIEYDVPVEGHIKVIVYDAQGRQITTLVDETQVAGRYRVSFDATGLSSGMYVYRMEAAGKSFSKTMLLVK